MEQSSVSPPPTLEELARRTARTLLLPYIIGYAAGAAPSQQPREVVVFVNPRTGSLTMIEGSAEVESILRGKEAPLPASKASIDAMPVVKVAEEGLECVICLSEFEVGGEAKEMPCKHKYHAVCIDKWLGERGTCPICRYKMPVEEEEQSKKEGGVDSDGEEEDGGERSRDPAFVFHVYFARRHTRRRRNRELDSDTESDSDSGQENEILDDNSVGEAREPSTQDMEIDIHSGSSSQEMDIDENSS